MYIDELAGIFNKYNNKYHSKIKIKPFGVKFSTYIDFGVEKNDKDTRFMVGDNVKKSKYENIFAKGYVPNWSKDVFVIKKVKNTVSCCGRMLLVILTMKNCWNVL